MPGAYHLAASVPAHHPIGEQEEGATQMIPAVESGPRFYIFLRILWDESEGLAMTYQLGHLLTFSTSFSARSLESLLFLPSLAATLLPFNADSGIVSAVEFAAIFGSTAGISECR